VTNLPGTALKRLTLTNFRNYAGLRLDVDAALVALAGPNGAGKTNLLEAISLLAPGRGLRGAAYEELAMNGGTRSWAIAAEIQTCDTDVRLGTGWTDPAGDAAAATSRAVLIDGHLQKSSGPLADHMRILWLTPAMDRIFAGPAGDRRRLLDRLVATFDPEHGARVSVFEKVMRERNLLLQEPRADALWLDSLEAHMAEAGVAIAAARLTAIDALQSHIDATRTETEFPWALVAIEGDLENALKDKPAVHVEDDYRRDLASSRRLDAGAGRTLSGPHRSDFLATHGPKNCPAQQCSTGEQKALLIGLILAHAHAVKTVSGTAPVLLLDEVAAHLDSRRRAGLFVSLAAIGSQAWMTGTDAHLFAQMGGNSRLLHVEAAGVAQMKRE
jgi:DNA replication and repair protein RecF